MYSMVIYDSRHTTRTFDFKTLKDALKAIYRSEFDPILVEGVVIVTPDKRYPKGIRKVGEYTYGYLPSKRKAEWHYHKWTNGFEGTDFFKITSQGELVKVKL